MARKRLSRRDFLRASALAAAGAALAACKTEVPKETVEIEATEEVEETVVVAAEPEVVNLTYMGWGFGEEENAVLAGIEKFQEENPGIKVQWIHNSSGEHLDKVLSMIAAGTPPDTAYISTGVYAKFAEEGVLLDITDLLQGDPVLGMEGYFIPQEYERSLYKGKFYGIGFCALAGHFYYNGAIFEEEGIEPPSNDPEEAWTWDHFLEVVTALTIDGNGKHPGESGFDRDNIKRWGVNYGRWGIPGQGAVFSNEGTIINQNTGLFELDQTPAVEAIQRVADLSLVHDVMPESAAMEELGMGTTQMLETGVLAMIVDGQWALSWLCKLDMPLGTGVAPKMKTPACDITTPFQGAISGTKYPEESWKWLAFLAGPWYQRQLCSIGIWLPNQTSLLTEAGLNNWITPGVHPEGYEKIAAEYVMKYGRNIYMPPGYQEGLQQYISPALDSVWNGNKSAKEALEAAVPQANEILKEFQV